MSAIFVAMFRRRWIVNAATMDRRGLGFDGDGVEGRSGSDGDWGWEGRRGLVSEARVAAMVFCTAGEYNFHESEVVKMK